MQAVVEQRQAAGRRLWTAALALALLWAVWLRIASRQAPESHDPAVRGFRRLVAWGRWVGRPVTAGETAREVVAALGQRAQAIAGQSRWRRRQVARAAAQVSGEGMQLLESVERSLFAPRGSFTPARLPERRLRASLAELWLARVILRVVGGPPA